MYLLKSEVLPSFTLTLLGFIDCLTTVIGVLYFGAVEINPLLAGIVSTSILAFIAIKVSATLCISTTYILAKKLLNKTEDKTTRSFKFGNIFMKFGFATIFVFLIGVVANNLIILLV